MSSPAGIVRRMRLAVGLSQRALAQRAGTSQPAIARYERGAAAPSWDTLQRIAGACGRRLNLEAEIEPDPADVELAAALLDREPRERLLALRRFARLRERVRTGR